MEKIILITGSTDGIGKQTALESAKKGAAVIIHGRNPIKVKKTVEEIKKKTKNENISSIIADFTDLKATEKSFMNFPHDKLDILINNACTFEHSFKESKDGFEYTFQICYLAHFIITKQLIPFLKKSSDARIINVSSMVHAHSLNLSFLEKAKYSGYTAYEVSKLANVLFTYKLAELLKNTDITVNCLHPGVISTKLLHAGWGIGGNPVSVGADNLLYVAFSDEVKGITGRYFFDKKPVKSSPITYDKKTIDEFWAWTLRKLGYKDYGIG